MDKIYAGELRGFQGVMQPTITLKYMQLMEENIWEWQGAFGPKITVK